MERWDFRSVRRYLSPRADGFTPGPLQVHVPFPSLQALAFPKRAKGRRVVRQLPDLSHNQTLPAILVWPDSRSCTIRFMLRPADLASTPDWVQPVTSDGSRVRWHIHPVSRWAAVRLPYHHQQHSGPSRCRVGASSARVLPHEPAPCLLI